MSTTPIVKTYNKGFGQVNLSTADVAEPTVIQFGPGISAGDLKLTLADSLISYPGGSYPVFAWKISFLNSTDGLLLQRGSAVLDGLDGVDHLAFADGTVWSVPQILAELRKPENVGQLLQGSSGDDLLTGNDYLIGRSINGFGGNDTLVSGSGNERLLGGDGSNTYRFLPGWGQDVVVSLHPTVESAPDFIEFAAGIKATDVTMSRQGEDLLLKHINGVDTVLVQSYFSGRLDETDAVAEIRFADGTRRLFADVYRQFAQKLTALADEVHGLSAADLFDGGGGSDSLDGGLGDDTLLGGQGDDTLDGGLGNDVINGGIGRDRLIGGAGDTFVFGSGFGQDTVEADGAIQLVFADGIASTDIVLTRSADALGLIATRRSTHESVLLARYDSNAGVKLSFSDGVSWSGAELASHIATGPVPPAQSLTGTSGADTLVATGNQDVLSGGAGSDTLVAGGNTVIDLSGNLSGDVDTIVLGADVRPEDLRIGMPMMNFVDRLYRPYSPFTSPYTPPLPTTSTLTIDTGNAQGTLRVVVPVSGNAFSQVALSFADGTRWSPAELDQRAHAGSARADALYGNPNVRDVFTFGAGHGNDTIYGFDGVQSTFPGDTTDMLVLDTDRVSFSIVWDSWNAGTDRYGHAVYNSVTSILVTLQDSGDTLKLYDIEGSDLPLVTLGSGLMLTVNELPNYQPGPGTGTQNADHLLGGSGADLLQGYAGDDDLRGQGGNDTLNGGSGNDTLEGGQGDDQILAGGGRNVVVFNRGDGHDAFTSSTTEGDTLRLGAGFKPEDVLISGGVQYIDGSPPYDWRISFAGSDDDISAIQYTPIFSSIVFANGVTWGAKDVRAAMSRGTPGRDYIYGTAGDELLSGGADNDMLTAKGGKDTLDGGAGNDNLVIDTLDAGQTTVLLGLNDGSDLASGLMDDIILFKADVKPSDLLISHAYLYGEQTTLLSLRGGDTLLKMEDRSNGTGNVVRFSDGTERKIAPGANLYIDMSLDNMPAAAAADDYILGKDGAADLIYGRGGQDDLRGRGGNDTLDGGTGQDWMRGGLGDDVYIVDNLGDHVVEATNEGHDLVKSSVSWILSPDVEDLVLTATGSANGTGNDLANAITGGAGANALSGDMGDDTFSGLAGNDVLTGGLGNDLLIGGKGADTYVFNRGDGRDTIVENDTSLLSTLLSPDLLKVGNAKSNQLWLTQSGNNLDIAIIGTSDKVTIQDWYKGSAYQVEKITALGDNKSLSAAKVNALVSAMAKFSAPAEGVTTLPTATQTGLNKILASNWS